jgi:hypothetical protein
MSIAVRSGDLYNMCYRGITLNPSQSRAQIPGINRLSGAARLSWAARIVLLRSQEEIEAPYSIVSMQRRHDMQQANSNDVEKPFGPGAFQRPPRSRSARSRREGNQSGTCKSCPGGMRHDGIIGPDMSVGTVAVLQQRNPGQDLESSSGSVGVLQHWRPCPAPRDAGPHARNPPRASSSGLGKRANEKDEGKAARCRMGRCGRYPGRCRSACKVYIRRSEPGLPPAQCSSDGDEW